MRLEKPRTSLIKPPQTAKSPNLTTAQINYIPIFRQNHHLAAAPSGVLIHGDETEKIRIP
jgi:hypothetical protein